MLRCLPLSLLCLTLLARAEDEPAKPLLRPAPIDKAVDRALEMLHKTQDRSAGSWGAGRVSRQNIAISSLCVMAFLSAGHVPGEGKYGATIERGVRWVLDQQRPNGVLAADGEGEQEMYHHGIATLMLAEVCGMLDGELGPPVRRGVEKAVAVILRAQRVGGVHGGGWRYRVQHVQGSDISVTGWQVMALRAAKNLGCDVPARAIDNAIAYIKSCQEARRGFDHGGFRYMPYSRVTVPCTGTSVLALELCGKDEHRSDEVLRGANYLIKRDNLPEWEGFHFFYGIYYGAQATFQVGGNYWSEYRSHLHRVLLRNQSTSGAWASSRGYEANYGANYGTAMAVLALTVEYRYLPIYQRDETERK